MQTLTEIKSLLSERGLRPRHRFGQNFLHDQNQLRKLVAAASIGPDDLILEVGPGTGTLTETLLATGAKVIACEIDRDLADLVDQRLAQTADPEHFQLIRGDCLEGKHAINPEIVRVIGGRPFKLVGNLPYNAATPLLMNLIINHGDQWRGSFVTVQKEVAQRIVAQSSTKDYGPLSVIVQTFAAAEVVAVVPSSCFWPQPDVTSAMIAIRARASIDGERVSLTSRDDRSSFAKFIGSVFAKRRKQLGAILGRERAWPAGITPDLRPEALSPGQLVVLWDSSRDWHARR